MASYLDSAVQKSVYKIGKFLGVNESPDGDTNLKTGEAAKMRNFRITAGHALQIRPGSKNIAGLISENEYTLTEGEAVAVYVELASPAATFTAYPSCTLNSVGLPTLSGEAVTLTGENAVSLQGYYFEYEGEIYRFKSVQEDATADTTGTVEVEGGYVRIGDTEQKAGYRRNGGTSGNAPTFGAALAMDASGALSLSGSGSTYMRIGRSPAQRFWKYTRTYRDYDDDGYYDYWYGYEVTAAAQKRFTWYGSKMGTESQTDNPAVRALWSGFVGGTEYICAACNGRLWSLSLDRDTGLWSKQETGSINTRGTVCLFGFGAKLYVLDGVDYYCWDGTTFGPVEGYVPCLATASLPLEQYEVFAGDGETTTFTLSQTDIYSVYRVSIVTSEGEGESETTAYTADLSKGTITMNEAPEKYQMIKVLYIADSDGGGGTAYEEVNKLTNKRSQLFSATGYSVTFNLVEDNILGVYRVEVDGEAVTSYTVDNSAGKVIFDEAPALGMNNVQIWWAVESSYRSQVVSKRYVEFFNGANDNRVFLYGDDNEAFYSGLDENGNATAEYFPDLNEMAIGEANLPITAMIRHYNRLLVFKPNSAYSVYYDTLTLEDGSTKAGFYISPINRDIGNEAPGQARLVNNRIRTLDGKSIYEWKSSSSSGNITGDQRNANRISQAVESTLKGFSPEDSICFFDKINHEYYAVYKGTAIVQNTDNEAWYIYTGFPATAMIVYRDELYYGTETGWLVHFSRDYRNDNGEAIDAYWESGSLDFGMDYMRKYSLMLWVGIKPEADAAVTVGADTENEGTQTKEIGVDVAAVARPQMQRIKFKTGRFTYYKLLFMSNSDRNTATVVSADISVKFTSVVR